MRRRVFLTGVGLVGVSGCLRLEGGSETGTGSVTAGSRTTVVTSASTTTAGSTGTATETTRPEASFPNGLSEDGVNSFLYPTHRQSLFASSFRAQWVKRDRESGSVRVQKQYRGEDGRALGNWRTSDGTQIEMYPTARGDFWRESLPSGPTYGNDMGNTDPSLWGDETQPLVAAGDWGSPSRANDERPAVWEVTAEGVADETVVPGTSHGAPGTVLSMTATMRVDENGVIRSLQSTYRLQDEDVGEFAYETTYSVDDVGAVTVEEPAWVSTAQEQAPTVTASVTDDRYVRFVIESGNRLEPGTLLVVDAEGDEPGFRYVLEDAIEPNTSIYLYRESERSSSGGIARESRPSDANPATLDDTYSFYARRRDEFYFHRIHDLS